jgi:hypothetical protein
MAVNSSRPNVGSISGEGCLKLMEAVEKIISVLNEATFSTSTPHYRPTTIYCQSNVVIYTTNTAVFGI